MIHHCIFVVYAEFEGGKSAPTRAEQIVKDKIEGELKIGNGFSFCQTATKSNCKQLKVSA